MLGWNLVYRATVIFLLATLLVWTYLTNEDTLINYVGGKLIPDTRIVWEIGIFGILALILFYFMVSTADHKTQATSYKAYSQRLQRELDVEKAELKGVKSTLSKEILHLESFIAILSDITKELTSAEKIDVLLKILLRRAADLLGSQKCAIFSVDNNNLIYVDSVGYRENIKNLSLKTDEESGQIGYAAKTGAFVSRNLVLYQDPARKYMLDNDKLETSFCQPIVHNGKSFAVICVGDTSESLTNEQAMHFLSILANSGTVALANTILVDKIREQSIRDSLTQLYNHQYFQKSLDMLLEQARKKRDALGFIMLDIDNFKEFNDTYGHQAGDFVLKKAADLLSSELKGENDIIARYGGEEFAAILPCRNADESYKIAERVRKAFEDTKFEFEKSLLGVTASIGVSAFDPAKQKDVERNTLIRYADEALYAAKGKGRNRAVMHGA